MTLQFHPLPGVDFYFLFFFTADIVIHYVTYYDTNTFETLTYMKTVKSFTISFAKR